MGKKGKDKKVVCEFRQDLVSGEWILISSLRAKRPHIYNHIKRGGLVSIKSKKDCPFENPQKSGNEEPLLWMPFPGSKSKDLKDWFVQVIPNKYPAVLDGDGCPEVERHGPYSRAEGIGYHEVIITRDHSRSFGEMSEDEIFLVFKAFLKRYKEIEKDKCIKYILIFHNHGPLAGASLSHPHSQLVALPIEPPDVGRSISGGLRFYKKNRQCAHCVMLKWERQEKKRIVYENKDFIALCPYASRVPYETRIFPKVHSSDFEETDERRLLSLSSVFKNTLVRLNKVLRKPDYNFFIHTSPAGIKKAPYYHWHIEILPRTYRWAGLELGTGVEVVSVPPEEAALSLRKSR